MVCWCNSVRVALMFRSFVRSFRCWFRPVGKHSSTCYSAVLVQPIIKYYTMNSIAYVHRRRRPRSSTTAFKAFLIVLWTTLECSSVVWTVEGFQAAHNRLVAPSTSLLQATRPKPETWSGSGTKSSRFGVRKRVKAVLEKAKNRTGVVNNSEGDSRASSITNGSASPTSFIDSEALIKEADQIAEQQSSSVLPTSLSEQVNEYGGSQASYVRESVTESIAPSPSMEMKLADESIAEEYEIEPLPFVLPTLTEEQRQLLQAGERVQEQSKMGREGSGFVVLDVKAPPYIVWECLLDFEAYPEYIDTVRSMRMFTNTHLKSSYIAEKPVLPGTGRAARHYGTASITRASFVLSKFRLNIAAIHKYRPHPDGHYMVFTLDRACKNVVMQDAKGIWYTQQNPDGRGEEYTRVWLLCEVKVSSMLPSFIVDYAAERAMPRATTWLQPTVDAMKVKWLADHPELY